MAPKPKKVPATGVQTEQTISSGAPSTEGNAADVSTMEAAGSAASAPEDTGQSSGPHTPEEHATVEDGAGNQAGPATGAMFNPRDEVLRVTHLNQLVNFAQQVDIERHHRTASLFVTPEFTEDQPPSGMRVTCSVDGFRRGGQRHPAGATVYALDHFTPDQLEQLLSDDNFTVELV